MKLKMIVIGVSLVIMSHLVADCNKNEVMKMIDKGFSKSEINSICGNSRSTKAKWVTPSNSKCVSYGGKIENGTCSADWNTAKGICSGIGGRLPSIDELKKVIVDCGGIINNYKRNKKNSSYQSCYKSKGFNNSSHYWSSTTNASYTSHAWVVDFNYGDDGNGDKTYSFFVRCVRAGQ